MKLSKKLFVMMVVISLIVAGCTNKTKETIIDGNDVSQKNPTDKVATSEDPEKSPEAEPRSREKLYIRFWKCFLMMSLLQILAYTLGIILKMPVCPKQMR